ncbi:hypothetical protein PFNF135_04395 [Plasmodium falciparum NF135/5.C10]|uniref:Surface antigen n=1 Tax=Plasmodium falciparum NF135/5.C10 TaxID=1036726 RepID=W4IC31_PLAFA|nr:hypothetical protein PFNF135_04395 [Plasmodium falciparum NF135/5.C10]
MKAVMENYNRQTSDRFKEYDEKMQSKRIQCKEQCNKEIQKIILKDKIEKQMAQQLTTLQTDIQNDAIPTCVCEKSLADKTEKVCLNCGKTMGAVAPAWGLVSGIGYVAWTHYVPFAISKAATDAGMKVVIDVLKKLGAEKLIPEICEKISSIDDFSKVRTFADIIQKHFEAFCAAKSSTGDGAISAGICKNVINGSTGGSAAKQIVSGALRTIDEKAPLTANFKTVEVTTTDHSFNYGNNLFNFTL